jgi:hypothetical protein
MGLSKMLRGCRCYVGKTLFGKQWCWTNPIDIWGKTSTMCCRYFLLNKYSHLHILLDHESNVELGTELLLGDRQMLSLKWEIIKVIETNLMVC